jgi:hypothetical protein
MRKVHAPDVPRRTATGGGMSKVVMQTIVSVDGLIATEGDQVGPLFDWFETG